VRQPVYDLGATAARLLVDRLNGKGQTVRKVVLKTEIVERASMREAL
jgi:LacI family transcriptional regulator